VYKKSFIYSIGFVLSIVLAHPIKVLGANDLGGTPPETGDSVPDDRTGAGTHNKPIYKPPVAGAPTVRSGAGSRSIDIPDIDKDLFLTVLAPNHTGHTISEQPRLYWYISKVVETPVVVTILYADPLAKGASPEPVLEKKVQVVKEGIQIFDLSRYNVKLKTGVEYEWTIRIPTNLDNPSQEMTSIGIIKRITQPSELVKKVKTAQEKEAPIIYAQAGMWYDAISVLLNLIAKYPEDDNLQRQQMSLFEEVGLTDILKN